MASSMQSWANRVQEAKKENAAMIQETRSVEEQLGNLGRVQSNFADIARKERSALQSEMQSIQQRAMNVDAMTKTAAAEKAEAESVMAQAALEYQDMVHTIERIQEQERDLQGRDNLQAILEAETGAWAEEERDRRRTIKQLENEVREFRTSSKAAEEAELQNEQRLQEELMAQRKCRDTDAGLERPAAFEWLKSGQPLSQITNRTMKFGAKRDAYGNDVSHRASMA